jgi:hypothetical protein
MARVQLALAAKQAMPTANRHPGMEPMTHWNVASLTAMQTRTSLRVTLGFCHFFKYIRVNMASTIVPTYPK